jgi:hypothetical protein
MKSIRPARQLILDVRQLYETMNERIRNALVFMVALPVLGLLMGGVYTIPAMRVTSCREPWYTLLLGVGLSVTVVAIGAACKLTWPLLGGAWICACVVLALRRSLGKLDHNLERFGLVHAFALGGMFWLVLLAR